MENKVSICITYYNQEEFVEESLDSVLAIDFPCDFEILCGDDGSTDETVNIIKEYQQKYPDIIKYTVMVRNGNEKSINRASSNRLNLLENATGDYITFLDGDDFYCDKEFVKNAIKILETYPDIVVCAYNFKYLNNGKTELFKQEMKQGKIKSEDYIRKGLYTPSGACIFRNIQNKEKMNCLREINNFDDNGITIYFLQFGNLYYIDRPIYVYRQSEESIWNKMTAAEQHLINSLDYKLISDTAPKFKNQIAKRQLYSVLKTYFDKNSIKLKLGNKYEQYLEKSVKNNDIFIKNLLKWKELTIKDKLDTNLMFLSFIKKAIFK